MPPRFAYWTILAGGLPTSFRAADKDELMPTFRRLKEKHSDAEMKYFARGKLWSSPEEARRAFTALNSPGPRGTKGGPGGDRERRGRDWRPGGEHRDPRQRFKDAKKARNQDRREQRWSRKKETQTKPHGDPLAPRRDRRPAVQGTRHGPSAGQGRPYGGGQRRPFDTPRRFERNEDPPPRPPRPDREPPPSREPKPGPPPRPSEPAIKPPGPPERGHARKGGGFRRKRRQKE
jgi:hypothetical protein